MQNLGLIEVARLSLGHGRARRENAMILPTLRRQPPPCAHVVGMLLQERISSRVPQFRAVHLRKISENADGLVLTLGEKDFDLRLEALMSSAVILPVTFEAHTPPELSLSRSIIRVRS